MKISFCIIRREFISVVNYSEMESLNPGNRLHLFENALSLSFIEMLSELSGKKDTMKVTNTQSINEIEYPAILFRRKKD